ncbi:unnamed protein product [Acanthocheilonema viteae]|uniref:SPT2 homolog N-terminal domain-containing protein n=1 Tax=Acanthocheilonema viteae TaxID=6277 RepID=A0A498S404_ACAVI|nr:unnamed protein product [Acanthocheilonema viteae]
MDIFDDILKQASSNTKNASKEIRKIDEARQKTKKCTNVRLAAERKRSKIVKPPVEKQKVLVSLIKSSLAKGGIVVLHPVSAFYFQFVIPKKKTRDDSDVDKSRVALFLKKQEEEKRKTLTEKKKQKEELIKLRLQSYGGKANKKLAKQFGSTPIELQQKYGNDREHEEHLKKQQIKEKVSFMLYVWLIKTYVIVSYMRQHKSYSDIQATYLFMTTTLGTSMHRSADQEESDRLNNELRGNIVKALERKKVVEKMAGAGSCRNGPYRIAINKKNSLRYLTKEDSPGPSSSCVSEGKSRKIDTKIVSKRRLPPSESNFLFLMKKAEAIQNGKASPSPPLPSPPPAKKKTHNELLPRDIREIKFPEDKSKPTSRNNKKAATIQRSNVTKRMNDIQTGHTKEQKVPPFISSGSTSTPSSRRYLPGDIRYQGPAPEQSQTSVKMNNNPSIVAKTNVKESDNKDIQARGPRRINKENLARAGDQQQNPSIQMMSQERAISRFKTHKHLHLKEQRRLEEMRRLREDDELDEDVDDEEYDSEMDDFIDDSEFDEHLKRGDLEETLRLINPRYDKNRWKLRERMIDDRHMEASYRDIAREEKQSSRIGLIEDIREAYCGKSITL